MSWRETLKDIRNNKGMTFAQFCTDVATEKDTILKFTFKPQHDDPTMKDRDNAQTVAYIARVGYIHSKARSYALRARGVVVWSLLNEQARISVVSDLSKQYLGDFEEEAGDWEAISDSLHERLWTGRGEMRRLNRGEG